MNETVGLPQICFALSSPSSLAMADGPIGGDWGWGDGFWVGQGCLTVFLHNDRIIGRYFEGANSEPTWEQM